MGSLGDVLGASGGPLRAALGPAGGLGGHLSGKGSACEFRFRFLRPYSGPLGGFWSSLGRPLELYGGSVGSSGDPLGTIEAILGDLGSFLGSVGQSEARKSENTRILRKTHGKLVFWGSWSFRGGPLGALLGRRGGILERLERIWGHL